KLLHVGNWRFGDAAETAGRLDCDHLDLWIDEPRPASINHGASAGERKAKKPNSGSCSRAHNDQPTAGVTFGLNRDRSRRPAVTAERRIRSDWPTPNTMFRLRHNGLRHSSFVGAHARGIRPNTDRRLRLSRLRRRIIVASRHVRRDVIHDLLDARALYQFHG